MKHFIKPLALSISLAISGPTFAADFVPQSSEQPAYALEAQQTLVEQPFVQQEPVEYLSAEDQIQQFMETKHWQQGWDNNKKRLFVVRMESFDSENPAYDDSFITKRSQFVTLATMAAKAEMVEYMRTEMSAVDMLHAPGTDVHAELNKKYLQAEKKLKAQQAEFVKILAEFDQAEADKLRGVTWEDRAKATWDGIIKRIDSEYDVKQLEQAKQDKYQKAKERYTSAMAELEQLEQEANKLKGEVKLESTSMVETLAKAPILGSTVLAQAESWNPEDEKYEVATLMVWSPKLEQAAKAIITGEPLVLKPKNGSTVQEWLAKQEVSTMVGSRQFVDKNGERWFIGAFAMPADGSSSLVRKNRGIAELMAKKEAAVALYADIETQKQAKIALQVRSGGLGSKDVTTTATSFAETTRQQIENRHINGLSKLYSKTVTHPISQQKIYVVAYGLSASSASEALAIEYSAFDAAATANRSQNSSVQQRKNLEGNLQASKTQVAETSTKAVSTSSSQRTSNKSTSTNNNTTKTNTLFNAPSIDDDDF